MEARSPACFGFRQLTLDTILDVGHRELEIGLIVTADLQLYVLTVGRGNSERESQPPSFGNL